MKWCRSTAVSNVGRRLCPVRVAAANRAYICPALNGSPRGKSAGTWTKRSGITGSRNAWLPRASCSRSLSPRCDETVTQAPQRGVIELTGPFCFTVFLPCVYNKTFLLLAFSRVPEILPFNKSKSLNWLKNSELTPPFLAVKVSHPTKGGQSPGCPRSGKSSVP
jgi:hypothetical protein